MLCKDTRLIEDSLAEALWKISQKPTEVNNVDYNC